MLQREIVLKILPFDNVQGFRLVTASKKVLLGEIRWLRSCEVYLGQIFLYLARHTN